MAEELKVKQLFDEETIKAVGGMNAEQIRGELKKVGLEPKDTSDEKLVKGIQDGLKQAETKSVNEIVKLRDDVLNAAGGGDEEGGDSKDNGKDSNISKTAEGFWDVHSPKAGKDNLVNFAKDNKITAATACIGLAGLGAAALSVGELIVKKVKSARAKEKKI